MNSKHQMRRKSGFTLIELIVVVAIIGVLMGLILPAVQQSRSAARRTGCANKMRQLAIALTSFSTTRRQFPSGIRGPQSQDFASSSWLTQILPYIEHESIWNEAVADYQRDPIPFRSHGGMRTAVSDFLCPSDTDAVGVHWPHDSFIACSTNYIGVLGVSYEENDGVLFLNSKTRPADIRDGLSNTLMVGERPPSPDFWYGWWYAGQGRDYSGSPDMLLGVNERLAPPSKGTSTWLESCDVGRYEFGSGQYGNQCDTLHFWSYHPGGSVFAFADGSVEFLNYEIEQTTLNIYSTRSAGDVVTR